MNENILQIWDEIKAQLKTEVNPDVYENYFARINEIYKVSNNSVYLVVENAFYKKRINDGYLDKMNYYLSQFSPENRYKFILITKQDRENDIKQSQAKHYDFEKQTPNGLNPNLTFSTFVVGDSNRLAHRVAMLVAEQLSEIANPVYIFGDVGLGKTHLMQAIGNSILEYKDNKKVLYVRTQDFVEDFVNSSRDN